MNESVADKLANTADWSEDLCEAIVQLVREVEDEWENDMAKGEVGDALIAINDRIDESRAAA